MVLRNEVFIWNNDELESTGVEVDGLIVFDASDMFADIHFDKSDKDSATGVVKTFGESYNETFTSDLKRIEWWDEWAKNRLQEKNRIKELTAKLLLSNLYNYDQALLSAASYLGESGPITARDYFIDKMTCELLRETLPIQSEEIDTSSLWFRMAREFVDCVYLVLYERLRLLTPGLRLISYPEKGTDNTDCRWIEDVDCDFDNNCVRILIPYIINKRKGYGGTDNYRHYSS